MSEKRKAFLPTYRQANHRVGDRVCSDIILPSGRWVAGSKFETPLAYKSPPVDVVAERLAARKGEKWANPRPGLGTVVKSSDNRRDLIVKLDATAELVHRDCRELIHSNAGRILSNQQVHGMIETITKEDKTRARLYSSMDKDEVQEAIKYGNTLPLPSMFIEAQRARQAALGRNSATSTASSTSSSSSSSDSAATNAFSSAVTPGPAASTTAENKPASTTIVLRGADGIERQIEVPFQVTAASVSGAADASSSSPSSCAATTAAASTAASEAHPVAIDGSVVALAALNISSANLSSDSALASHMSGDAAADPSTAGGTVVYAPVYLPPNALAPLAGAPGFFVPGLVDANHADAHAHAHAMPAVLSGKNSKPRLGLRGATPSVAGRAATPSAIAASLYAKENHRSATPIPSANLPTAAPVGTAGGISGRVTPMAVGFRTPVVAATPKPADTSASVSLSATQKAVPKASNLRRPTTSAGTTTGSASSKKPAEPFSLARLEAEGGGLDTIDLARTRTPVVVHTSASAINAGMSARGVSGFRPQSYVTAPRDAALAHAGSEAIGI